MADRKEVKHVKSVPVTTAAGDSDHVDVYQTFIHHLTNDGPGTIPGMKSLRLRSTGGSVNWLAKGKYQVVQTGQQLISTDPDAE